MIRIPADALRLAINNIRRGLDNPGNKAAMFLARANLATLEDYVVAADEEGNNGKPANEPQEAQECAHEGQTERRAQCGDKAPQGSRPRLEPNGVAVPGDRMN